MGQTVIVIGGGAAGFFGAITCARQNRQQRVVLLEKTRKLLAKVSISGGGRCNVTHHCFSPAAFVRHYPRGAKQLRHPFETFGARETVDWFEEKGVKLKTEADGRMFPVSYSSQTIIDCLLREAQQAGVQIRTGVGVEKIDFPQDLMTTSPGLKLHLQTGEILAADKVLICTGGFPKPESYGWMLPSGHTLVPPVPSLFTFNVPHSPLRDLMGVSVGRARVKVVGQKLEEEGPLLITHWGFSGPVVLRLSAWGARLLHSLHYHFQILINWIPEYKEDGLRQQLQAMRKEQARKTISAHAFFGLPLRLWKALLALADIPEDMRWADLPGKNQNKLLESLIRCPFEVRGKTTFKEEFVTCGGIPLQEVSMQTMESKKIPGLFFAGEVLDVDGITGGFNFQAAWTTGYLAGKAMAAAIPENSLSDRANPEVKL
jgi:predicted Rossmann fold flavoprotein